MILCKQHFIDDILVRDQEAAGSSPVAPTIGNKQKDGSYKPSFLYVHPPIIPLTSLRQLLYTIVAA